MRALFPRQPEFFIQSTTQVTHRWLRIPRSDRRGMAGATVNYPDLSHIDFKDLKLEDGSDIDQSMFEGLNPYSNNGKDTGFSYEDAKMDHDMDLHDFDVNGIGGAAQPSSLVQTLETVGFWVLVAVLVAFCAQALLEPLIHDMKEAWRRHVRAVKYGRIGTRTAAAEMACAEEDEAGLLEVAMGAFTKRKTVVCVVDLGDGKEPRSCDAYVGSLEKISQLPSVLTDACRGSSDAELSSLNLVDKYLRGAVTLQYTSADGVLTNVGKFGQTTPEMLLAATGFRVTLVHEEGDTKK